MIQAIRGKSAQASVILYASSTIEKIFASSLLNLYVTNDIINKNIQKTTKRVNFNNCFSSTFIKGFKIFCVNNAEGANKVAEAVDMIADIRAQKNTI